MKSYILKTIVWFGVLSGAISLILACFGFGVVEFYKIKNETTTKIRSQMDILAYALQPTLLFDDRDAADKTLRFLQDDPSINRVLLYKGNGELFTAFIRVNKLGNIHLVKNLIYDNKLVGRLEIEAVYLGITDRYLTYLLLSLLIIFISIPASYFISAPIRRQVAQGVVQLEQQSHRLRLLADQVAATEQKERKRIAALIHDHLQQVLVASKLQLALALKAWKKEDYEKMHIAVVRSEEFIDESIRAAKSLTIELRPPVLYEDGLVAAFQWLANKFKNDHGLEVTVRAADIPVVLSDTLKIMLFESVKELLFNVVKYAGVQKAELILSYKKGEVMVVVKDEGIGFDNVQHIEKLSSDKGFGLFSIRERLRLLEGDLNIKSLAGKGAEVQITVPVEIPAVGEAPQPIAELSDRRQQERVESDKRIKILLADDHKIVREGLANLLKENPLFNVIAQAENGVEAVEKAQLYRPDIIIMDINMPKLNGIEATRAIKNRFAHIDIIGLSVQDEKDVTDSMKKAGAVTLLNKAGAPQDLISTILSVHKNSTQ